MSDDASILASAIQKQRAGDLSAARKLYLQVLSKLPADSTATFQLGLLEMQRGRLNEALNAFQSFASLQPENADAFSNIGNCHKLLGNPSAAEAAYRKALELQPNHAGAMSNLATVLDSNGDKEQAITLLRTAIHLDPNNARFAVNLGAILCRLHRFTEAEALLRKALSIDPNNAKAAYTLGSALHGMGNLHQAAEMFSKAATLRPNFADALNNLGNVHKESGDFDAAITAYESAVRAKSDFLPAINNAGSMLRTAGRLEQAEFILRQGLSHNPDNPTLYTNLGNVLKDSGLLEDALDCYRKAIGLDPNSTVAHANLAYTLSFASLEPQPVLEECIRWNHQHAQSLRPKFLNFPNDLSTVRRIRIGYVSPDFRNHCQALFLVPLLSNHDHERYEIFCYSSVERPDEVTRRFEKYADTWREVRHLDDDTLADLIRADQIDILVDLTMFMAGSRSLLFARKPAPVQIAWLAYPGTTGMTAIDYRFSDPRLDPPGYEKYYTERTVRLPDSFWCYDPLTDEPEFNQLPARTTGTLTLGCLNNPCKLTDETLSLWATVMHALPTARLMLLAPRGSHLDHLQNRLISHGIDLERTCFVPFQTRADYLRSYHQIDVGVDTFPYNGHTSSLDSMWMGVPVVTRVGKTCVGRAGLSQLFQLGLTHLACNDDAAFVDAIINLANDLPALSELRRSLRTRLAQSPLMDGQRFARNIETAYHETWQNFCHERPAQT